MKALTSSDIYFLIGSEPFDSEYKKAFGGSPEGQRRWFTETFGQKKGTYKFNTRAAYVYDMIVQRARLLRELEDGCPFENSAYLGDGDCDF